MSQRKIIFRADGGPTIGMGHFIRTLALAELLKDNFYCIYAIQSPSDYQINEIENVCHARIDLPENDSHYEMFLNSLRGDEIVVLDNYYFNTDYQRAIKEKGCKLVCIDDMHDKHYVADVVINHAPLRIDLFSTAVYTKLLIGFEYALLRSDFLQYQHDRKITKSIMTKVFLCIGGADFNNLTSKILDDLIEIGEIESITIIIGNAYQSYEGLVDKISVYSKRKQIKLLRNVNARDLIRQMMLSDFAIVPCSTILLEVISQKVPVITGYYVENQKEIANYLNDKFKNVLVLGDLNETKIQQKHIKRLGENLELPYSPVINSNINDLLLSVFNSLNNELEIQCRNAEIKDIDIYFLWANNEFVRKNAINSDVIEYSNHVLWFHSKLNDKDSFLYIFEKDNTAIGQVRFDKSNSDFTVDFSVDEKFRGRSFGKSILKLGLEKLCHQFNSDKKFKVKALVKVNNTASSRVFESFNFLNNGIVEIENSSYFQFEKELTK